MRVREDGLREDPSDQYAREYYKYMLDKELTRTQIDFNSPQLYERPSLILWLKRLSQEKFLFSRSTLFLAVRLLDEFMDNFDVANHRLFAVALVCLFISAKHEECESQVPRVSELVNILKALPVEYPSGHEINSQALRQLECFILKFRFCRIFFPTVSHFADFFNTRSLTYEDTNVLQLDRDVLKCVVKKRMEDILDRVFLGNFSPAVTQLMNTRPSCLAAACLYVSRMDAGITPAWPKSLAVLTGYKKSDIVVVSSVILKTWRAKTPGKLKQEENMKRSFDRGELSNKTRKIR